MVNIISIPMISIMMVVDIYDTNLSGDDGEYHVNIHTYTHDIHHDGGGYHDINDTYLSGDDGEYHVHIHNHIHDIHHDGGGGNRIPECNKLK